MKINRTIKYAAIFYVTAFVCYIFGLCLGGLLRGFTPIEIFVSKGSTIVDFFIVSTVMLIFS